MKGIIKTCLKSIYPVSTIHNFDFQIRRLMNMRDLAIVIVTMKMIAITLQDDFEETTTLVFLIDVPARLLILRFFVPIFFVFHLNKGFAYVVKFINQHAYSG